MTDVEFSEETAYNASLERTQKKAPKKGLLNFVIKSGLAKDETGAIIILVVIGILAFVLSVVIFAMGLR